MRKPIFIYGAGGLGREVKAMLNQLTDWELNGFYDDHTLNEKQCEGIPLLGGLKELLETESTLDVVLAFGDPQFKLKVSVQLQQNTHIRFPVLIHPAALLMDSTTIRLGDGSIIGAGAVLTTNIELGKHCLVNLNATIGHDTIIGEACSLMPGSNLAGGVQLGKGVLIGSGSSVLNNIIIDDHARVGAGAVVTKNVSSGTTVVGVPAREHKRL